MTIATTTRLRVSARRVALSRPHRVAAAMGLIALLIAAGATPAPAVVKVAYRVGFGDQTRPAVWTPVFVTLANEPDPRSGRTSDFVGRVEVRLGETIGDRGVTFSTPVDLPANARKRVVLYVRLTDAPQEPRLHVVRPNGTDIITPQSLTNGAAGRVNIERNPGIGLCAIVLDQFDQLTNLPSRTTLGREVRAVQIDPRHIPNQWYGLQALDALVLPSLTEDQFTPEQLEAIIGWVRGGGELIVLGGTDVLLPPNHRLMEIMPVEPLGLAEVDLLNIQDQVEQALITDVTPRAGAVAMEHGRLAGGQRVPLGFRRAEGLGAVHFWCFSPRQRLNSLDVAAQTLWEIPFLQDYSGFLRDVWLEKFRPELFAGSVLENATKPPNVLNITILIVIYFIVVGPLNFYLLQKRRRVELAWLTIPLVVFAFSVGMYSVGVLTMGSENIERDFTLMGNLAHERLRRTIDDRGDRSGSGRCRGRLFELRHTALPLPSDASPSGLPRGAGSALRADDRSGPPRPHRPTRRHEDGTLRDGSVGMVAHPV
jgi:hypothetical protein